MELRHLKYFVAVAEELHFSRAAERVGIAQPPFSQQIKGLEEEVGAPLLLRTKRRVELTAAGRAFLTEARKVLAQAGHALDMARRAARGEVGQLVVGFVSSAVYGKFASVFGLMRARHPDVALVLQDLTSEEQVEAMKAHRLDVGLVRPPVLMAEAFTLRVIGREPLVAALPETHPLAKRKRLELAALAGEPFLLVPRHLGPGFYDQIIGLCARAGFTPKLVQEARTDPDYCEPDCRWHGRVHRSGVHAESPSRRHSLSLLRTFGGCRSGRHVAPARRLPGASLLPGAGLGSGGIETAPEASRFCELTLEA